MISYSSFKKSFCSVTLFYLLIFYICFNGLTSARAVEIEMGITQDLNGYTRDLLKAVDQYLLKCFEHQTKIGEMESKPEALAIPLQMWNYESWVWQMSWIHDLLGNEDNNIVAVSSPMPVLLQWWPMNQTNDIDAVSSPMPFLLQGWPINQVPAILILEVKWRRVILGQLWQRGVEWAKLFTNNNCSNIDGNNNNKNIYNPFMFLENAHAALIFHCKEDTQYWKVAEKNLDLNGFTWSLILLYGGI